MQYSATHSVECAAPAEDVYALVTDTAVWPVLLGLCVATQVLEVEGNQRLIEITARLHGRSMSWRSRRTLLPEALGVDAEIVEPMPLVAAMRTSWRVVALSAGRSLLLLEHFYDLCDDVTGLVDGVSTRAEAEAFVSSAVHANSISELADYRRAAEQRATGTAGVHHARHARELRADPERVYAMVRDPLRWPELFPACTGATILEDGPAGEVSRIQAEQHGRTVWWDTRRNYRDDIRRIDYELLVPMPFVSTMRGQWRVVELGVDRCLLFVDRWWTMLEDVSGIRDDVTTAAEAAAFVRQYVGRNAADELTAIENYVGARPPAVAGAPR